MTRPALLALLGMLLVLSGCGGGGGSEDSAASEPTPAAAPADASAAQRAALAAQHRSGDPEAEGSSGGKSATPAAVKAAFRRAAGFPLALEEDAGTHEVLTVASTDADGNPLPQADARLEKWGSFTLYVGEGGKRLADVATLGDVVPSDPPDKAGIVWTETVDAVGQKSNNATAFHAGGRIMLTWLGGAERRTDATFRRLQAVLRRFDG